MIDKEVEHLPITKSVRIYRVSQEWTNPSNKKYNAWTYSLDLTEAYSLFRCRAASFGKDHCRTQMQSIETVGEWRTDASWEKTGGIVRLVDESELTS